VTSIIYRGTQMVKTGGDIYYSMDGGTDYRTPSGCVYSIKTNSADTVDVSFRQNWTSQAQAFDIEIHWVLRRGDHGLYAYAILDHPAGYPDTSVGEWRMVWRTPDDLLERVYVDDVRNWQAPSVADIAAAEATGISEIVKLTTGVRAGRYDVKYQYSAEYENIGCWGHASNTNGLGAWLVTGNYEYFNDGPTKQDLTVDWAYRLIHFGRNHFSPGSLTHGDAGVAWRKIYGPFLLYLNYNPAGGDACWADAKAQVDAEKSAWPYSWLTGNSDYPLADARGAVTGRFLVNDSFKPSLSTSNAWVGLADPSVDWQFDSDHYQYWVRAAADGSFTIANVRPGTYTLHAFTDGVMGAYAFSNVVVTAAATNALGDKTWNVPHVGNFLLWEVGTANRSASDFRHGSTDWYEGYYWDRFAREFSNPLEYNIGQSDWRTDLNYAHSSYKVNGVRNQWKWRFNFLMTSTNTSGNATLNIAVASVHGATLNVYINNESSTFTSFSVPSPPGGGNALLRQGIHAKYYTRQISIPVNRFRIGTNTLTLVMASTSGDGNHYMYDAISLELPSKPPLPAGYDLTWTGGLNANAWNLATTANWSSNTTARVFNTGNKVLFDDTGLNDPAIHLSGALLPGLATVYAMKSFTFAGSGSLAGAMTLAKTGPGTLTINTTNSFTGATSVTNGALILNGALNASAVTIRSGATLGGTGRLGAGLTMLSGSFLAPGNGAGTITITNTLTQSGGVTNRFDLSDDPTGTLKTNDLIKVFGNVALSGTNTIFVNPLDGSLEAGIYPLIQFTGTLSGGISNLVVRGVVGKPFTLTNISGALALVVIQSRPPTNIVWKGGLAANLWDQSGTSNWLNGVATDVFAFGDSVNFDNTGSTSPAVNLLGGLNPSSVLVNASVHYTFTGSGGISGDGGLTKNNSGTLTMLTTNDYTGVTTINGGTLAVSSLDNGGLPSAIGAAANDSTNLVFQNGATLRYLGATRNTDRGAIFNAGGGVIEVTNVTANLILNGILDGSAGLTKSGPGTLTLGNDNTYAGSSLISGGVLQMGAGAAAGSLGGGDVINNALLQFNRADNVTVGSAISGNGIVVKIGGGTTTLAASNSYTGGTTNAAGRLLLANNSALGTGPLTFNTTSGSVLLADGVTVTNAWNIAATITTDVMMDCPSGTATWAGPVSIGSGASFRPGTSAGIGTLVYLGNASMGGANFIVPRGNVVIASNGVVTAGGTTCAIGRSTLGTYGASLTARDNATLTFNGGLQFGGAQASPGPMSLTIQDNATVSSGVNSFNLHNSTASSSTTTVNLNGGTLAVGSFTKVQTGANQTATINFNGGTLRASANSAALLPVLAGLTANVVTGGATVHDGNFLVTINQPLLHDPSLGASADGGLTKLGIGGLALGGQNTFNGPTKILTGTLLLGSAGALSNSSSIYIASGAELDTQGIGTFSIGAGKSISGNGNVNGDFILGSGATLAPGTNGVGRLAFIWNLTFAPGSTNLFEISKSPLTNDTVVVWSGGTLTNGGTLIVSNLAGTLAAGDNFKLFDAANYSGSFSAVILPALASGLAWNTSTLATNGTISVVAITPPSFASISANGDELVITGSGPANGKFFVLSSTNVALPIASWTRLATNQFSGAGTFTFTNATTPGVPQTFYRLQLP
jgi:rhamnogalacturonan endolyase